MAVYFSFPSVFTHIYLKLVLYEFGPGTPIVNKISCSQGTGNLLGTASSFICHLLLAIYFHFCKCYDEQHGCAYRLLFFFFSRFWIISLGKIVRRLPCCFPKVLCHFIIFTATYEVLVLPHLNSHGYYHIQFFLGEWDKLGDGD